MGQDVLVEQQIHDGQKLVEHLANHGFHVAAAGWIKIDDDSRWYLYIASSVVDREGPTKAYGVVHPLIRGMPTPLWIDPFDVKLIREADPLALGIRQMHQRYPALLPTWYRQPRLGGVSIEAAYLYPPVGATSPTVP
jgi:hypothetical protein